MLSFHYSIVSCHLYVLYFSRRTVNVRDPQNSKLFLSCITFLTQCDVPLSTGQAQPAAAAPELQDHRSRRRRASPGFSPHSHTQSCQRVPLFVDFEEIGWSGWIISPRGYNAYHCKGSCPFPLGGNLRATNHATVRSIMHALKLSRDEVGAPCCVPDRLQSISLLYFDDEENVVLKQYDDMVALSCGCH